MRILRKKLKFVRSCCNMEWIKFTDKMPDKDITVLVWLNGEVALACRYKDHMYNAETLSPLNPQFWCEIAPPKVED